jgi:hypothetical protein
MRKALLELGRHSKMTSIQRSVVEMQKRSSSATLLLLLPKRDDLARRVHRVCVARWLLQELPVVILTSGALRPLSRALLAVYRQQSLRRSQSFGPDKLRPSVRLLTNAVPFSNAGQASSLRGLPRSRIQAGCAVRTDICHHLATSYGTHDSPLPMCHGRSGAAALVPPTSTLIGISSEGSELVRKSLVLIGILALMQIHVSVILIANCLHPAHCAQELVCSVIGPALDARYSICTLKEQDSLTDCASYKSKAPIDS